MNHQWLGVIVMLLSFGVGWIARDVKHVAEQLRRDRDQQNANMRAALRGRR